MAHNELPAAQRINELLLSLFQRLPSVAAYTTLPSVNFVRREYALIFQGLACEVEKKSDLEASRGEVCDDLANFVIRELVSKRFDFDNDRLINEMIKVKKSDIEAVHKDLDSSLFVVDKSSRIHLDGQGPLVNPFSQTGPNLVMHGHRTTNDLVSNVRRSDHGNPYIRSRNPL